MFSVNVVEPYIILFKFTVYLVGFLGFYLIFFPVSFTRFSYYKKTFKEIDLYNGFTKNINSLYMICNEEKVSNVIVTRIAIWNSGTEEIYGKKIVEERPLVLGVKEGSDTRILDCSVYYRTDEYNRFNPCKCPGDDKKYILEFEYIEKRGGVILEIMHTGRVDDLYIDCFIKGGKGIIEIDKQEAKVRTPLNKSIQALFIRITKCVANKYYPNENNPASWHYGSRMLGIEIILASWIISIALSFVFNEGSSFNIAQIVINLGTYIAYVPLMLSIMGSFWPYRIPYKLKKHL